TSHSAWCVGPRRDRTHLSFARRNGGGRPLDGKSRSELGDEFSEILRIAALCRTTYNRTPDDDPVRTSGRNRSDMSTGRYSEAHTEREGRNPVKGGNSTPQVLRQARSRTRPGTKSPLPSLLNLGTIGDGVGEGDAELEEIRPSRLAGRCDRFRPPELRLAGHPVDDESGATLRRGAAGCVRAAALAFPTI